MMKIYVMFICELEETGRPLILKNCICNKQKKGLDGHHCSPVTFNHVKSTLIYNVGVCQPFLSRAEQLTVSMVNKDIMQRPCSASIN